MAQPIDDRVLRAAQRAVARARGEEISVEPVEVSTSPSVSAKLYRVNVPSSDAVVSRETLSESESRRVQAQERDGHRHRPLFSSKSEEEAAGVVVPRGDVPGANRAVSTSGATSPSLPIAESAANLNYGGLDNPQAVVCEDAASTTPEILDPELAHSLEDDLSRTAEIPRVRPMNRYTASAWTAEKKVAAEAASRFLDTFFAQLQHCGVHNVVVSPGLRSAPLAMKAYERFASVHVDIDERSAGFYALGLAKATGNVVVLICGNASSLANLMPVVLEAEAARVPLLVLSADCPADMPSAGMPTSCDQAHIFGAHVKKYIQMPQASLKEETLTFARQAALDACIAAHGALPNVASADAGPVHLNFPFDEPLKPSKNLVPVETSPLPAAVVAGQGLMSNNVAGLFNLIQGKRVIALCGEGTCGGVADARLLLNFAHKRNIPLLADPLSGLRCYSDSLIVDRYDAIFGGERAPHAEVVIRFGRWPLSQRTMDAVRSMNALQIVVDMRDTRDQTSSTDLFVRCAPTVFAEALTHYKDKRTASKRACKEWRLLNREATEHVRDIRIRDDNNELEGAYIYETMEEAPADSLVWCANGMSLRALDTFYCKADKQLRVLCNCGLGGSEGTLSSAFGAAQFFEQTTLITGDLAFLKDVNALTLQHEFHERQLHDDKKLPSIIVVLLNNNGGALFDVEMERSFEPYYERLFLTPQSVDYKRIADGFGVTLRTVSSVNTFRRTYSSLLGEPGINILEVPLPLAGAQARYQEYWTL